ncbi:MAG TPA: hypothetical protein VE644_07390 [Gaiellaceae bacterium]|nr:hypothetical protein [Gaiellaceae bacterium]
MRDLRRHLRLTQALVLRLDSLSNASLAAFLLASSWDALFETFGLPLPRPAFYAQLLGAALVAFAVVEWALAGKPGERAVTVAAAVGSALGAAVLAVWLAAGETGADTHGLVALWSVAAFLAVAAGAHAVVLIRARGS